MCHLRNKNKYCESLNHAEIRDELSRQKDEQRQKPWYQNVPGVFERQTTGAAMQSKNEEK